MNLELIAIEIGDSVKDITSVNEINRIAKAIFRFPYLEFPNMSITSERAQLIYNWILSLKEHNCSTDEKKELLIAFAERLHPKLLPLLHSFGFGLSDQNPLDKNDTVNNENKKIFIGHGRSHVWRELKDFIVDRLELEYEEFNRISPAGRATSDRLKEMLEVSRIAFLVMTGGDEHADNLLHARENVIHEVGLFQGRLGFERAIILLEKGCEDFSNHSRNYIYSISKREYKGSL